MKMDVTNPNLYSSGAFSLIGSLNSVVIVSFPSPILFLSPSFMGIGLVIQESAKPKVIPKLTSFRVGGHVWVIGYC